MKEAYRAVNTSAYFAGMASLAFALPVVAANSTAPPFGVLFYAALIGGFVGVAVGAFGYAILKAMEATAAPNPPHDGTKEQAPPPAQDDSQQPSSQGVSFRLGAVGSSEENSKPPHPPTHPTTPSTRPDGRLGTGDMD